MNDVLELEPTAPTRSLATTANATPADLVRYAMESGADLDRLEKLMQMQIAWEEREAVKAYNDAFTGFKAEAVRILKSRSVTDGPLRGKRYAELYAVVNAITPALSAHKLSAAWKLTKDERDWIEVTCTLKHVSGASESVSMGGPPDAGGAKNAIQARASTISYLQRYTLKAITGLSEQEDDDDGNGSGGNEPAQPRTPPPQRMSERAVPADAPQVATPEGDQRPSAAPRNTGPTEDASPPASEGEKMNVIVTARTRKVDLGAKLSALGIALDPTTLAGLTKAQFKLLKGAL